MEIKYFNPKNCKYTTSKVLKIDGDIVYCQNKYSEYKESLQNLREFKDKPNPNWHGLEAKPLVKLIGFK